MRRARLVARLAAGCVALLATPPRAVASDWVEMTSPYAAATDGAVRLAEQLAPKLKRDRLQVIFLNVAKCDAGQGWCQAFSSALESRLVDSGIHFLPEEGRDAVRAQIAQEGVYQQSSMMVDPEKAVALGKQRAFQAFVTINVKSDDDNERLVDAKAISIEKAVVTISETLHIFQKSETSKTFGSYFRGAVFMGAGLGVAALGVQQALAEQERGNEAYSKYKKAGDADEASKWREKTKKSDNLKAAYEVAGVAGLGLAAYGWFKMGTEETSAKYYKVESAARRRSLSAPSLVLVPSDSGWGLGLAWRR